MYAVNLKDRITSAACDDGDDLRCWWNNIESTQLVRRRPRHRSTGISTIGADVVYGGKVISASPWEGKLIRLTTGCWKASTPVCNTDPSLWGVPSGGASPAPTRAPSEILYQFKNATGGTKNTLGPAPQALGLALDETGNTWVFAGTGRYYTQLSGTGDKSRHVRSILGGCERSCASRIRRVC